MYFSDLLPQIEPKWHEAFVRFIETGEASSEFLTYLNSDQGCQKAMERLLSAHVKTLRPLMQAVAGTASRRAKAAAAAPKARRPRRSTTNGRHAHTNART